MTEFIYKTDGIRVESPDPEIEEVLQRFKLFPNTLPIERVFVDRANYNGLRIQIDMRCIDIATKTPVKLSFSHHLGSVLDLQYYDQDKAQIVGRALREALRWALCHEIDEILMLDDNHFVEPHPERKGTNETVGTLLRR